MALYYIAQDYNKDRSELITQLICRLNGEDRIIEKRSPLLEAESKPQSPGHGKLIELRSKFDGGMVVKDFLQIIEKGEYKHTNPETGEVVQFVIEKVESITRPSA